MKRRTFFQMLLAFLGVPLLPKAAAKLDSIPVATTFNPGSIAGPVGGALIGTIQPFIGKAIPSGWLPCDGQTLTRADYPQLWDVLRDSNEEPCLPDVRLPDLEAKLPPCWSEQAGTIGPQPEFQLIQESEPVSEPLPGFEPIRYIIKATDKFDLCQQQPAAVGGPPT